MWTVFMQLMLNNFDSLLYCHTRRIVQQKISLRTTISQSHNET